MTDAFPNSADEFYARRDDRTNRCVTQRQYQTVGCLVTADPDALDTPTGEVLFLTSCNLLSRWCRRVEILRDKRDHPFAHKPLSRFGNLYTYTLASMQDADPFGSFQVVDRPSDSCRVQLHLGSHPTRQADHTVAVTAMGWEACLATDEEPTLKLACNGNVLGAIGAACISGAQLFKLAIEADPASFIKDGVFDLFGLRRGTTTAQQVATSVCDAGRILLVGAGSVGSAAAFFMHLAGVVGELTVIEKDAVKIENFNRSPIFGKATFCLNKGDALQKQLQNTSVHIIDTFNGWWDDFIRTRGRVPNASDVWLPLANDFGVRWSIQNNYPPLMVHGSTGANWNVNFGRHIPMHGDCLADRFPETTPAEAMKCATGEIPTGVTESVDAALPFLSFFAGFLVAADLYRLCIPQYPQTPNYALFDFGGTLETIQSWDRGSRDTCICRTQSASLYNTFNDKTRFAQLFN